MNQPLRPLPAAIADRIDRFVRDGGASAAAVVVLRGSGVVFGHAVGTTRSLRRDPSGALCADPGVAIDLHTAFDLASLTKPLATSTLLAAAVAAGDLRLDDPLGRWLPDVAPVMADRTLRALLGHGSGWPAWRDFAAMVGDRCDAEARARMRAAVLATPPEAAAGAAAVYTDLGFLALGWAWEAACGRRLDAPFAPSDVAGALHFRPSAASDAAAAAPADPVVATEVWSRRCPDGRALCGVVHDDNAAALGGVAGHAGLFGSAVAVAEAGRGWLQAVGHGRDFVAPDGRQVPAALARGWVQAAAAPGTTWRSGWDTPSRPTSTAGRLASERAFGHLGFVGTSLWIDPERDALVVLLTNRVHPSRDETAAIRALRPAVHDAVWAAIDAQALD